MRCGQCHNEDTKVIESREAGDGEAIRRRRVCAKCEHRFTTYERVEHPQLVVIKNDGTRQLYSRQKLLSGLYRACEKTSVSNMQLERMVLAIEHELYACGDPEVSSIKLGEIVMDKLADINEVAYVRFASVYRRFKDIASFENELSHIKQRTNKNT